MDYIGMQYELVGIQYRLYWNTVWTILEYSMDYTGIQYRLY